MINDLDAKNKVLALRGALGADALAELVKEQTNARDACIDEDGDIWVSGPMRGHWLGDDEAGRFLEWVQFLRA